MDTINQVLQHELMGVSGQQLSFADEFVIYLFEQHKTGLQVTVSIRADSLPDELWAKMYFHELVDLAADVNGKLVASCTTL